ncbi:hypothetical protein LUZ61_001189 [Rhynchospora tenuis]|uniref:Terpene synthase n=1 Tax=Rhynchospora tenuis TaxID=198213 RepID=A0AAD5ZGX9_9POAL|nr:hypothetical protein LUZ61_001189 [Rhynchospora tenuis]
MAQSFKLPFGTQLSQTNSRVFSNRSRIYAHLQSPQTTVQEKEIGNAKKACKLKKEASRMIYKEDMLRDKLELVDALQQLGVAYHFKVEIHDMLTNIHKSKVENLLETTNDDLYLVSLLFRVLRTNEFSVPEDIFKNYFNDKGDCKEKLSSDMKVMLSLVDQYALPVIAIIRRPPAMAWVQPPDNGNPEQNNLTTRVDQYALPVIAIIRRPPAMAWVQPPDNGNPEQNNLTTRWDINATGPLPEYMKMCCLALFDRVEGHACEVLEKKGLNVTPILRRALKDLCKAYLVEERWYRNGYVPTLKEYLDNAWVSIGGIVVLSYAYCMNDDVNATNLKQFLSGYPDIVRYSSMICRLYNDLATSNDELKRGDNNKSIQCYMHHEKVSESVARQKIKDLIWKYWKLLNGEVVGNSAFHKYFRDAALDVPRMAQFLYQHGDGFANPDGETKDQVTLLFLEPVK